jgi:dolichyl-phosphate beta-glucosyltransferase
VKRNTTSFIIPVFNGAEFIIGTLNDLIKKIKISQFDFEIIVVNDGSSDETEFMLKKEMDKNNNITVISYKKNMGKGYALKKGVLESTGDIVILLDSDSNISLEYLISNLDELNDFDLVIGSKYHEKSKIYVPLRRKILTKIFHLIVVICTSIEVSDTQVGLKIGKGTEMRKIFSVMSINRYAFDVELLVIATLLKLRIKEIPVKLEIKFFDTSWVSSGAVMLKDVLKIAYKQKIKRQYHKQLFK